LSPQGSCLGPLLYNIYANDLNNLFPDCEIIMYADDLVIHKSGADLELLSAFINLCLLKLDDWCKFNKLTLNSNKTKWMLFTTRTVYNLPSLYVGQ